VFFAHRNPIDATAGSIWRFGWQRDEKAKRSTTGTHDLLLFRDIIEAMLYAAFADGRLLGDADLVRERLRASCWLALPPDAEPEEFRYARVQNRLVHPEANDKRLDLFDAHGDRHPGTGEHIVCLQPEFTADRIKPLQPCTISVWRRHGVDQAAAWFQAASKQPPYYQSRLTDE
jgi:hypothetical protein